MSNKDTIYPFQLRPGVWVYLRLPTDLNRSEVDRLVRGDRRHDYDARMRQTGEAE